MFVALRAVRHFREIHVASQRTDGNTVHTENRFVNMRVHGKRKMPKGRRALDGVAKEGRLIIRHTDSERAILDSAAFIAGKPTSTWARDELLRLAKEATTAKPSVKKSPGKKPKA